MADAVKPQGNRGMPAATVAGEEMKHSPSPALNDEVHSDAEGPKDDEATHSLKKLGDSDTNLEVEMKSSGPVEVVATRPGFIYNMRKSTGDRFAIGSMVEFGDWMSLADSKLEAKRVAEARAKKLKARS